MAHDLLVHTLCELAGNRRGKYWLRVLVYTQLSCVQKVMLGLVSKLLLDSVVAEVRQVW